MSRYGKDQNKTMERVKMCLDIIGYFLVFISGVSFGHHIYGNTKNTRKNDLKKCWLCGGTGKLPTGFHGKGSCSNADVIGDRFPEPCHICKGKGYI